MWILRRAPLVRGLGFPDAAFGIAAYGAELALDLVGGHRCGPTTTLVLGSGALAMAAAGSCWLHCKASSGTGARCGRSRLH